MVRSSPVLPVPFEGGKENNKNRLFNHYNAIPVKTKQKRQTKAEVCFYKHRIGLRIMLAQDSQALI